MSSDQTGSGVGARARLPNKYILAYTAQHDLASVLSLLSDDQYFTSPQDRYERCEEVIVQLIRQGYASKALVLYHALDLGTEDCFDWFLVLVQVTPEPPLP